MAKRRRRWLTRRVLSAIVLGTLLSCAFLIALGVRLQQAQRATATAQVETVAVLIATVTNTGTSTMIPMEPLAATQAALEIIQTDQSATITQQARPTTPATETRPPRDTLVPSPTLSDTPIPSPIPPTDAPVQTFYTASSVNVRACPELTCDIVTTLQTGIAIEAVGAENGASFQGSTLWRIVNIGGQRAYIHSKLVSQTPPRPTSPPVQAQPAQPPPQPLPPQQNQPPAQQWSCNGNQYNCSDFSTCNQVMSYFNTCPGDPSRLDGDDDGVPCESLCR